LQSTKVIEAQEIDHLQRVSHAVDPPGEPVVCQGIPIIHRIAPPLAEFAEVVGRDASDNSRMAVPIELEQLLMGPDVRGIVRNEHGDITCELYAAPRRPCSQR